MLRDTCRMVKSGMRNNLRLGHAVAEAKTMIGGGAFGHISPFSGLYGFLITQTAMPSTWGQMKAYSWGRSHYTQTHVNDLDSVGFPANQHAHERGFSSAAQGRSA